MCECVCVCELVLLQTPGREDLNDDNRVVVEGNQHRQMFSFLPRSAASDIWGEVSSGSHSLQKHTLFSLFPRYLNPTAAFRSVK